MLCPVTSEAGDDRAWHYISIISGEGCGRELGYIQEGDEDVPNMTGGGTACAKQFAKVFFFVFFF